MNNLDLTQFYDGLSESWDNTRPRYTTEIFKKILSLLDEKTTSILDFGCGTGLFCKFVRENLTNIEIEGIDISSQMVEKARANCPACQFYIGDIFSIELPRYDAIISKDVFNHISDLQKTFRKMDDLINPGGTLIIANRERESEARQRIIFELKTLRYRISIENYSFAPTKDEIELFLKSLAGFNESHKSIIKERLGSLGEYYILIAKKR